MGLCRANPQFYTGSDHGRRSDSEGPRAYEPARRFCHVSTYVLLVAGSRHSSRSRQGTPAAENGTMHKAGSGSGGRASSNGRLQERSAERKPLKVTLKTGGARDGASGVLAKKATESGQKRPRKEHD